MAKWTREYGYDEDGRRTILISENSGEKKPEFKTPWFVKLDLKIMKVLFFGMVLMTVVLALCTRCTSGVPF